MLKSADAATVADTTFQLLDDIVLQLEGHTVYDNVTFIGMCLPSQVSSRAAWHTALYNRMYANFARHGAGVSC